MAPHPTRSAFVRASTLSLGSIAFGSLIVTLLEILRLILQALRNNANADGHRESLAVCTIIHYTDYRLCSCWGCLSLLCRMFRWLRREHGGIFQQVSGINKMGYFWSTDLGFWKDTRILRLLSMGNLTSKPRRAHGTFSRIVESMLSWMILWSGWVSDIQIRPVFLRSWLCSSHLGGILCWHALLSVRLSVSSMWVEIQCHCFVRRSRIRW